ncbi:MAG: DUF4163 domain-containing protein [Oscillibacter sp.]|nr:DUF4163 domain-containing protein [Oscillibacter sp.]
MKSENHQTSPYLRALYGLLPLALVLLFLTACALRPVQPSAPSEPAPGLPENLTFEIETEPDSDISRAEDGSIIAAYSYQLPVMRIYRKNGAPVTEETAASGREMDAVEMARTFNQAFRQWKSEADFPALEELARNDYAQKQSDNVKWDYHYEQGLESSVYQTNRFVSVSGRFYYYAGGAHPNTVLLGWNYDMEKAAFFYAGQLFQDTEAVTEELFHMAQERAAEWNMTPEEFFWEDYTDILNAWSESSAVVTFDEFNMTVSFSPYDIASYAAGEQIFTIPLTWLKQYMNQYGQHLLFT